MQPITDWDLVAANPEFRALLKAKARFIVPATIALSSTISPLPILVGYAPAFMSTPVIGRGQHRLPVRALAVLHGVDRSRGCTCAPPAASTAMAQADAGTPRTPRMRDKERG